MYYRLSKYLSIPRYNTLSIQPPLYPPRGTGPIGKIAATLAILTFGYSTLFCHVLSCMMSMNLT